MRGTQTSGGKIAAFLCEVHKYITCFTFWLEKMTVTGQSKKVKITMNLCTNVEMPAKIRTFMLSFPKTTMYHCLYPPVYAIVQLDHSRDARSAAGRSWVGEPQASLVSAASKLAR